MKPSWYHDGEEPDYRFTLANERTFLAWLRTAMALIAGAVALDQFTPPYPNARLWNATAIALALTGALLAGLAYRRWARVQRAMRRQRPLPPDWLPVAVGAVTATVAIIVFLTFLTGS